MKPTRVEAAGNVSLDVSLSGTSMTGPGADITADNQKYAATGVAWASGTDLSGSPAPFDLNTCKSGYTGTPEYKPVYWGINIPAGQVSGAYTGTNTITAVKNNWVNPDDWCEVP